MSIPAFDANGNLPVGIHYTEWDELKDHFGGNPRREELLSGLKKALRGLQMAGSGIVYIDGSFVTRKEYPNDFDGCWDVIGVNTTLLDPVLLDFSDGRRAQKAKFGGELFPAQLPNGAGGKTFLEFFQIDKETGYPKGIIKLDLRRWQP